MRNLLFPSLCIPYKPTNPGQSMYKTYMWVASPKSTRLRGIRTSNLVNIHTNRTHILSIWANPLDNHQNHLTVTSALVVENKAVMPQKSQELHPKINLYSTVRTASPGSDHRFETAQPGRYVHKGTNPGHSSCLHFGFCCPKSSPTFDQQKICRSVSQVLPGEHIGVGVMIIGYFSMKASNV